VFRLDKKVAGEEMNVAIDGQLSADSIDLVETCCDEALADGKRIDLVLRDVRSVDESGQALLRRLAAKGVHLIGNGVYTSYLVRSLKPAGQ
jgi:predicted RNA polymerase sigma factor